MPASRRVCFRFATTSAVTFLESADASLLVQPVAAVGPTGPTPSFSWWPLCRPFRRTKGLRLNTVRGIARTLRTVLSQAVEDGKLPANPALRMGRYLRRGDEAKTPIQVLTRDEAALLVGTAEAHFPRWHPWVLLALCTGLRLGEQIGLQWGDVDWNGRFVVVQRNFVRGVLTSPKSHRRRRVDLSSQLLTTLVGWRRFLQARAMEKGTNTPQWVFRSLSGTPLEERNIRHVFKRMLEKAELRQIRIHDLRHTFASLLLQQGESVAYVKEQLGHASIQITVDTYGHLIPGANRGAVDRLDDDISTHPFASQAHPETQMDDAVERPKFFRLSGEPDFRELEPHPRLAGWARRLASCCVAPQAANWKYLRAAGSQVSVGASPADR